MLFPSYFYQYNNKNYLIFERTNSEYIFTIYTRLYAKLIDFQYDLLNPSLFKQRIFFWVSLFIKTHLKWSLLKQFILNKGTIAQCNK
jgi:hypothetical protein